MKYLLRLLDSADPSASLRHAAYAVVVVISCSWLTYDLVRRPMDGSWVAAFAALLAAVVTSKVVGAPSA